MTSEAMFHNMRADLKRYHRRQRSPSLIVVLRRRYVFRAIVIYRFGRWIDLTLTFPVFLPIRYLLLAVYFCLRFIMAEAVGIHIAKEAVISKGFWIAHFGGIAIGNCRIGRHCSVHQHVRPDINAASDQEGELLIGDNVWIGPYACVLGPVTVGDNVTISAGAVVTQDVKEGYLVAGDPARGINSNYDNTDLLCGREI
jgi:serine O-acetyltransferase